MGSSSYTRPYQGVTPSTEGAEEITSTRTAAAAVPGNRTKFVTPKKNYFDVLRSVGYLLTVPLYFIFIYYLRNSLAYNSL